MVRDQDAARFVARARSEGAERFTIRPPGRRPVYYVTRYSYHSRTRSSPGLGLDARANPGILAGLELARDTQTTILSDQTLLADDCWLASAERPVAYELFAPVYATDRPY